MDDKGFISLEYIFYFTVILIIATGMLFYASSTITSELNIADNINHRLILDSVADKISQVNSNGGGYSKSLELPDLKENYIITVENDKLTIDYDSKKATVDISLLNIDSKYKLYGGNSYSVEKNDDGKIVII